MRLFDASDRMPYLNADPALAGIAPPQPGPCRSYGKIWRCIEADMETCRVCRPMRPSTLPRSKALWTWYSDSATATN